MFERFTHEARQVVVAAQAEARDLRHDYIGTEHLLLGLIRQERGIAHKALASLQISYENARAEVVRRAELGESVSPNQMPFTPRAKRVLELSLREALSLGHEHIGTEHLLLALTTAKEGMAFDILVELGADGRAIRGKVLDLLPTRTPEQPRAGSASGGASGRAAGVAMSASVGSRAVGDIAWLDGVGPVLNRMGAEIRGKLQRSADSGDLLMVLALSPGTLAAKALRDLGIEIGVLQDAIQRSRAAAASPVAELRKQFHELRRAKEDAIANGRFEEATRLREQERELMGQVRAAGEPSPEALTEIHSRLGLADVPPGTAPSTSRTRETDD